MTKKLLGNVAEQFNLGNIGQESSVMRAIIISLMIALAGVQACRAEKPDYKHYVPPQKDLSGPTFAGLAARGERKVYKGQELETIGMPCGGIGAGQLYVRGDGTLVAPTPPPGPIEQGFAVHIRTAGATPQVRRLSRDNFDDIGFIGEYPIATILYRLKNKGALPVNIDAEVFSPWM